jgi:outer membrane cobalamin receptor
MGENLDISGDVSYTGRRSDTRIFSDLSSQQERLGGYARVDLAAHLTIPQRTRADFPTQVIFRVDNALDRRYPGVSGFEAPQRRFSIAVRLLVEY